MLLNNLPSQLTPKMLNKNLAEMGFHPATTLATRNRVLDELEGPSSTTAILGCFLKLPLRLE